MRTAIIALIIIAIFSFNSAIARVIEYNGILLDSTGQSLADGNYNVSFTIYDNSSKGSLLWQSIGEINLMVIDGQFSCILGSSNPLPDSISSYDSLWLEINLLSEPYISRSVFLPLIEQHSVNDNVIQDSNRNNNYGNEKIDFPDPRYLGKPSIDKYLSSKSKSFRNKSSYWEVAFKTGLGLIGKYKASSSYGSGSVTIKNSFCTAGELLYMDAKRTHAIGVGGEIQVNNYLGNDLCSFAFYSLYLTIKFPIKLYISDDHYLYIGGRLGYNFFTGSDRLIESSPDLVKLKGGVTGAAGFGVMFNNAYFIELMYAANNGKYEYDHITSNINFSRIIMMIGVNLNLNN